MDRTQGNIQSVHNSLLEPGESLTNRRGKLAVQLVEFYEDDLVSVNSVYSKALPYLRFLALTPAKYRALYVPASNYRPCLLPIIEP
jgi:hypothetical protein